MTDEMIRILTQAASETGWDTSINFDSNVVIFTYNGDYSYEVRVKSLEIKEILQELENNVFFFSAKKLTAEFIEQLDTNEVSLTQLPQSKINEIYDQASLVGEKLTTLRDRVTQISSLA